MIRSINCISATYQISALENIGEVLAKDEFSLVFVQPHGEERLVLGTNPSVPMSLKGLIVDQSGIATVIVLFVVILDSVQIAIRVDVRGEDKDASRVRITEVCGGGHGKGPDGDGLADTDRISDQCDWNGEQFLFLVFAGLYDMPDGARVEPKCIASIGKREIIWVRTCRDQCYGKRSVGSVRDGLGVGQEENWICTTHLRSSKEYLLTAMRAKSLAGLGMGALGLGRASMSCGERI